MSRVRLYSVILFSGAALLALVPLAAFGQDGVVLIDQNTPFQMVTGCPGVQTHLGFPIVICRSGSYRLTSNLTVSDPNTDVISILADDVTLDLNGFTLSGPTKCTRPEGKVQCTTTGTGNGIKSSNRNTRITNGTVRGFGGDGLYLLQIGTVERVHAESNGWSGIHVGDGIVTRCTSTLNLGNGITAGDAVISFSTVEFNGYDGINGGGTVVNNTVLGNGHDGIRAGMILGNLLSNNIGYGISGGPGSGYGNNLMWFNHGGSVNGGTSMGNNVCDGASC